MTMPLVSIIVHTKNSERTIKEHLDSIKKQSYPNIEIIAVDNFSTDATPRIIKKYTKHFYSKGPERSAQRNFGAEKAKGMYVYFPDSDMVLQRNVVADCVNVLKNSTNTKMVIVPEVSVGNSFWARCKALERSCYIGDDNIEAARFFEKKAFFELGGYDVEITGPEDWDLPKRMSKKYKAVRIKSYILHDEGELSLTTLIKKKYYYGKKASIYLSKNKARSNTIQTIYLLRPAFYKNWKKLLSDPLHFMGMIVMLSAEQIAGGVGYFKGMK